MPRSMKVWKHFLDSSQMCLLTAQSFSSNEFFCNSDHLKILYPQLRSWAFIFQLRHFVIKCFFQLVDCT